MGWNTRSSLSRVMIIGVVWLLTSEALEAAVSGPVGQATGFVHTSNVCSGVVEVDSGAGYTCSVLKNGTAQCWGSNDYGKLGDGTTTDSNVPVVLSGISIVRSISAGGRHTCTVSAKGAARCWGWNKFGQLGDGRTTDSKVPMLVSGLRNVRTRSISATYCHTCAVLGDGTARCWGCNKNGQLGDGTTTDRRVPVLVSGLDNVASCVSITTGCWRGL